jgi:hypothetical protein
MSLAWGLVIAGLRRQAVILLGAVRALIGLGLGRSDFDGVIGATELAHLAADAKPRPFREDLAGLEGENLLRAECDADIAALAITLTYDVEVGLWGLIAHKLFFQYIRECSSLSKTKIQLIYQWMTITAYM